MRIVITGEGIISAIGINKEDTLDALINNRSGIESAKYLQTNHKEFPVGEVKFSNSELKQKLGIETSQEISRTSLMAIYAVRDALADANVSLSDYVGKRIVFVSGTTVGGMDITERHFLSGDIDKDVDFIKYHDCGGNTKSIIDYFYNITESVTISTACSSAANAIIIGAELLKNNEADIVIAGGSEALSVFHLNGFNSLMILDKDKCRPFDAMRAGLNLGEGAAYVIMESEESARERNAIPHAFLTGYANTCDAFHQTATSPNGEGAYLAMSKALEMAGLAPTDIQYVNAHGTGTPNNDVTEGEAIKRVFGEKLPYISSTKGFTGHTTSASGSIEAVISILAIKNHFVPANINWTQQIENSFSPSMGIKNVKISNVLCNSFGFGGNDSSLVLSSSWVGSTDSVKSIIIDDSDIETIAVSELNSEEDLKSIKEFISPMEARRMGKLMKASLITSYRVLAESGIQVPDAIITGTAYGCVENSEKILMELLESGEETVKPTLFMQSTHNTISSNIGIHTKCHGYNITYSQGNDSLSLALRDAKRLLKSGKFKNILVGFHDESTPLLRKLMSQAGVKEIKPIYSISMLLSCRK